MLRLALEYLFYEIVGNLGLIARQLGSPGAGIVTAAQRERRQDDGGGPPLSPLAQCLGRLLGELEPSARSEFTGLSRIEGEELGPDLNQLSAGTETRQRYRQVAARNQHELGAGRNPVDEEGEDRPARLRRHDVH